MKPALFISDLHLCRERPHINRIFFEFLEGVAPGADSLYILGDLFEYWAGDDDLPDAFNSELCAGLRNLSGKGVAIYVMHGNRDFLLGDSFTAACGARLIPDPHLIDLFGTPTLLMHGDTLCLDDLPYQAFRAQVRDPAWQKGFLAQPLSARKAAIEELRKRSEQEIQKKSMALMDVTPAAVEQILRDYHYPRLIHGHTHRPARHLHKVDGRTCERWVLSDWYEHGAYLCCDETGCAPVALPV